MFRSLRHSRLRRRGRKVLAASSSLVLIVAILKLSACGQPDFVTEADVVTILNLPRDDAQQQALIDNGRRLFLRHSCNNCHVVEGPTRGAPRLANLYTTQATLIDGTQIDRDRGYLIRSIIQPRETIVAGYPQQMSNYRHLPAEEVAALVAYLEKHSPLPDIALGEQDSTEAPLPKPQE